LRRSQFTFEFIDPLRHPLDRCRLLGDELFKLFDLSVLGVHADHYCNSASWRNISYVVNGL